MVISAGLTGGTERCPFAAASADDDGRRLRAGDQAEIVIALAAVDVRIQAPFDEQLVECRDQAIVAGSSIEVEVNAPQRGEVIHRRRDNVVPLAAVEHHVDVARHDGLRIPAETNIQRIVTGSTIDRDAAGVGRIGEIGIERVVAGPKVGREVDAVNGRDEFARLNVRIDGGSQRDDIVTGSGIDRDTTRGWRKRDVGRDRVVAGSGIDLDVANPSEGLRNVIGDDVNSASVLSDRDVIVASIAGDSQRLAMIDDAHRGTEQFAVFESFDIRAEGGSATTLAGGCLQRIQNLIEPVTTEHDESPAWK